MPLENITEDTLLESYKKIQPGTMLHADELMKEKANMKSEDSKIYPTNSEIFWATTFYTADGIIYYLDKGKTPMLAITREKYNPVLQHIDEAFPELLAGRYYRPSLEDVQKALDDPSTVTIDLTKSSSHPEYHKLTERLYGRGEDYAAVMKMLQGYPDITVFRLGQNEVRELAKDGPIACAANLDGFEDGFWGIHTPNFWAVNINHRFAKHIRHVRGIPR